MSLAGAVEGPLPEWIEPQLATPVSGPPAGDDWIHEVKFDGYRMFCRVDLGHVRFFSRNHKDWSRPLPLLVRAASELRVERALIDGEVVALDERGASRFQLLQNALGRGDDSALVFYAFDLIYLDGFDFRGVPLVERKGLLSSVIESHRSLRYVDHMEGWGEAFYRQACESGLEGIISKRSTSRYRSGRSADWLKVKCLKRQEFVIGGYTDPVGSRSGFGALLVGVRNEQGELRYAGRVGTGYTEAVLFDLSKRLRRLERRDSPFVDPPKERDVHWVEPELVAEVSYSEWTDDGRLRQPSFHGLREDKPAREVVVERPLRIETVERVARISPEIAGVRLTHPNRVIYPDQGITKLELARFYESIADRILPHIVRRPLALVRCPKGQAEPCFYQKRANETLPPEIRTLEIPGEGPGVYIEDLPGLITLVQFGVLEIHPWGSRVEHLEQPDRITFDLDPGPGVAWPAVVEAAERVRDILGLKSFAKTAGGKGLHVVVPIEPRYAWDHVKQFTKEIAEQLSARHPKQYTARLLKTAREGRIFIDYLRNGRGATAIGAYSTRARPGAPVAAPVRWEDLASLGRGDPFRLGNLPPEDPWRDFFRVRQSLP
jgi:bifunctional non-homologous end joining protein LigD